MDKSTDSSNTTGSHGSSSGDTPPRTCKNISLGCGPPTASNSSSSAPSTASAASTSSSMPTPHNANPITRRHHGIPQWASAPLTATLQTSASQLPHINLNISTTTGGNFGVQVDPSISVENLKKIISKKLKVAKDRICLLHREKELHDGSLKDNNLMDGSKIILIPNVETGLLAQRPENTVMQALESLNDSQVNDFLSGKTPLNLSMRLGDHMMLIQLQLSTVNPANAAANANTSSCSATRTRSSQRISRSTFYNHHSHHHHHHTHHHPVEGATTTTTSSTATRKSSIDAGRPITSSRIQPTTAASSSTTSGIKSSDLSSFLSKRDYESLQNIVKSIAMAQPGRLVPALAALKQESTGTAWQAAVAPRTQNFRIIPTSTLPATNTNTPAFHHTAEANLLEQSPIKSLSNLVSSPIKTTAIKNIPSCAIASPAVSAPAAAHPPACRDPIAAKLTSCLCTRLSSTSTASAAAPKNCIETACVARPRSSQDGTVQARNIMVTSTPNQKPIAAAIAASAATALLHKTANNPITRAKHRHHHHHHHHHHHYHHHGSTTNNGSPAKPAVATTPRSASAICNASSNDSGFASDDSTLTATKSTSTSAATSLLPPTPVSANAAVELNDSGLGMSDTRTLAEASRNLTQTLRKLSKEVFTNKIDLSSCDEATRKSGSGAVIESMKNHGKGIYSGTFSGTLNPALQDRYGRPKRDISTVIHILNDLLSATPQYSRGAKISFEAPSTSAAAAAAAATTVSAAGAHTTLRKQPSRCPATHYKVTSRPSTSAGASANSSCTAPCAYGECNGHYASKSSTAKPNCCAELTSNTSATAASTSSAANAAAVSERTSCTCRFRTGAESGQRERELTCQKCLVEMENLKTKSKLDQLRLVMQQRKQKREARKQQGAPYGARLLGAATTAGLSDAHAATLAAAATATTAIGTTATPSPMPINTAPAQPSEVSPNHIVEEVDTAA